MNRRLVLLHVPALVLAASTRGVRAQPAPPIRIVVGAPPGGSTDTLAREIAPEMGRQLGRTVIVENRSGAGGNLAADFVAKAAPDGNTLLLSFTSHTINATLYPKLPFDPVADFTPLTMIATAPSVLVAHPELPVRSVRELIAYAKARPGQLSFAIGGIGSSLHLAGEAFKLRSGVFIVNIPYRGTAPAVADVLAGTVPLMFAAVGNTRALVAAGKLRALGVTSPQRLPQWPDVPAIARPCPASNRRPGSACSGRRGWRPMWSCASATRRALRCAAMRCASGSMPTARRRSAMRATSSRASFATM